MMWVSINYDECIAAFPLYVLYGFLWLNLNGTWSVEVIKG